MDINEKYNTQNFLSRIMTVHRTFKGIRVQNFIYQNCLVKSTKFRDKCLCALIILTIINIIANATLLKVYYILNTYLFDSYNSTRK